MIEEEDDTGGETPRVSMDAYRSDYLPERLSLNGDSTIRYEYCQKCGDYHQRGVNCASQPEYADMVSLRLDDEEEEYVKSKKHAVIFLGDVAVGKSALFRYYSQAVGVQALSELRQSLTIAGLGKVMLHVQDTAEQERFRSITNSYFRRASACVLVYNSHNTASFANLRVWLTILRSHCGDGIACCLVDNVRYSDRPTLVTEEEVQAFMASNNIEKHYRTRVGGNLLSGEVHIRSVISDLMDKALGIQRSIRPQRTATVVLEVKSESKVQTCCQRF